MAKNKNTLGKLVAFTTAVAAIGGTCYVFKDKIKAHPLYEKSKDKLNDLCAKFSDRCLNDDFDDTFFDDDDDSMNNVFKAEHGREYTSITINAKNDETDDLETEDNSSDTDLDDDDNANEDTIPIISFDKARNDKQDVTAYENEGLSDVSEDPDTLAEQDQLDF